MKIVLSILALIYTLLPYDFLPDFMIGWGWIDDIVVLYLVWRYFFKGQGWPFGTRRDGDTENDQGSDHAGKGDGGPAKDENEKTAQNRQGRNLKEPHEILGISRDATPAEIKSAYKELAGKYHPDKVLHLGDEFRILAERRFKEIQDAYEQLTKK